MPLFSSEPFGRQDMPARGRVNQDNAGVGRIDKSERCNDGAVVMPAGYIRKRSANVSYGSTLRIVTAGYINNVGCRRSRYVELLVKALHVNDTAVQSQLIFNRPVIGLEVL